MLMRKVIYTFGWINKGSVREGFLFLIWTLLEFDSDQLKDINLAVIYRITGCSWL
jgi:hypothetical protein